MDRRSFVKTCPLCIYGRFIPYKHEAWESWGFWCQFQGGSKVKHVELTYGFQICEGFPTLSPSPDMVAKTPWPTHMWLVVWVRSHNWLMKFSLFWNIQIEPQSLGFWKLCNKWEFVVSMPTRRQIWRFWALWSWFKIIFYLFNGSPNDPSSTPIILLGIS